MLLALLDTHDPLQAVLPSMITGLAVAMFVFWFSRMLAAGDEPTGDEWRFDTTRINELRRIDWLYRSVRPLFRTLSRFNRAAFPDTLVAVRRELQAAGLSRFWLPEEYLAKCEIIAIMSFPVISWFAIGIMGPAGIVIAATLAFILAWVLRIRLRQRARYRLQQIKRRLPYMLDLLTLLMEAGSTFLQSLEDGVREFAQHAIGLEFSRVLTDINMGKTRQEAFEALRNRLDDNDVTSLIGAIIQGESLGTPVAAIFRTQADVLRIKRTQAAETIAGEAGVNMLFPGVLVMMAAVCLILGPFLLNYLLFGFSL